MSYVGNTVITQGFTPQVDFFSGNASTTAFTLSRPVASVYQMIVNVANVDQNPGSAYTVSGNTITFASAPPSGTNNIWVEYTSLITQTIVPTGSYQVAGPVFVGSTIGYTDTGILQTFASNVNSYNQIILQNLSSGASASTNFNVSNNNGTSTTNYGEFGINSSGFSGTGSFSQAGYTYLASASTDLVLGTYGNNAIHFVVNSGATDAAIIDVNGNFGLGVTPSSWGLGHAIEISTTGNAFWSQGNAVYSTSGYYYSGGADKYAVTGKYAMYFQVASDAGKFIWASTSSTGTAGASASLNNLMTLNNSGNLSITTSAVTSVISARSGVSGDASQEAVQFIKYDNNSTTSQVFAKFFINQGGALSGQINANGANQAAFGSTSDITLKTNITPLASQLANINAMELIEFDYIESEGGGHNIGFSAQNMQTIYPDTVSTRADGKLTLTGWNKTEARLVKAIQELSAKVTALEAKVA